MLKEDKLAEEWLDKRYLKDMGVRKPCKEAFLAGLKAGREIEKEYVKNNAFTFHSSHKSLDFIYIILYNNDILEVII